MVVFGLGKNLLFKSILGRCDFVCIALYLQACLQHQHIKHGVKLKSTKNGCARAIIPSCLSVHDRCCGGMRRPAAASDGRQRRAAGLVVGVCIVLVERAHV